MAANDDNPPLWNSISDRNDKRNGISIKEKNCIAKETTTKKESKSADIKPETFGYNLKTRVCSSKNKMLLMHFDENIVTKNVFSALFQWVVTPNTIMFIFSGFNCEN